MTNSRVKLLLRRELRLPRGVNDQNIIFAIHASFPDVRNRSNLLYCKYRYP